MAIRQSLNTAGRSLMAAASIVYDFSVLDKMDEIEKQIDELQAQRTRLNETLSKDVRRVTPYFTE